jgi:hypothetical protein
MLYKGPLQPTIRMTLCALSATAHNVRYVLLNRNPLTPCKTVLLLDMKNQGLYGE